MASSFIESARGDGGFRRSPNLGGDISVAVDEALGRSGLSPSRTHSPHFANGFPSHLLDKGPQDAYLASLLSEERKRCEQHKDNYNKLKTEHRKLQSELIMLQDSVKQLTRHKTDMMNEHAEDVAKYETQITKLRQTVVELQTQVPVRDKLEALKSEMIMQVERPFRERMEAIEAENEATRAENAKVRHDLTFLRTEYEHSVQRNKAMVEDLKLQHEAEISNLTRDKDELIKRLHQDNTGDQDRMLNLQKENVTLNHKVKSLLGELEELRGQREKVGLESDHVQRLQQKQLTEFQATVRALQTEKDMLRKQCDHQGTEVKNLLDAQLELTKRLHEQEQIASTLRSQLESSHHESSLQLTQARLEAVKAHGTVERERDCLRGQLEDVKSRWEGRQMVVQQLESALREKEKECADKISSIREEEFHKLSSVNQEKQNLESRVQILERQKLEMDEQKHRDQLRQEQLLRDVQQGKDQAEKELSVLRSKLQQHQHMQREVEFERSRVTELHNQMMKFEAENQALHTSESELSELVAHLRQKVSTCNEELRRYKEHESAGKASADRVLAQHKSVWADEKVELQKRLSQLDDKLAACTKHNDQQSEDFSRKKQIYTKLVEKLRRKVELLSAEKQELQVKVDSVKGYVPPAIVQQIRKELRDLKNRHKEYKHIMLSGDITHQPIGHMSFASASVHNANFDISPNRSQESMELAALVKRIDKLDECQKRQMTNFGVVSPTISPIAGDYDSDS